ncbi:MAG: hypothetical protein KAV82_02585 [Phycisphaerae bacterium]|nr:hypothetical protein [Phycisphaerae bacterium]
MRSTKIIKRRFAQTACGLGVGAAAVIGLMVACTVPGLLGGAQDGEQEEPTPLDCSIINIVGNIQISRVSELPLLVMYNITATATNVRGFYVEVTGTDADAEEIGEDVILPEELNAGAGQTFNLDLAQLAGGFYRVGIRGTVGGKEVRCVSTGTLVTTATALPEIIAPDENIEIEVGDDIVIELDMHDPAGNLHWRLFYIGIDESIDVPEDELGTKIWSGRGDTNPILWSTDTVIPGDYRLGLSTTDSGMTVVETFAASGGDSSDIDEIRSVIYSPIISVVEPAPESTPTSPLIEVTKPSSTLLAELGEDNVVLIEFEGTILEPDAVDPHIEVFLTPDKQSDANKVVIEANLPPDTRSVETNTKTLPKDTYYVGATIDDGVNSPVTAYAKGRIEVAENIPALTVLDPDLTLPVKPGAEVEVRWATSNVSADEAKVDVFRRAVGPDLTPMDPEIQIMAAADADVTTATFTAAESGRFQVSVRLTFNDPTIEPIVKSAPSLVTVTTLPLIMWVGDLAEFDEEVQSEPDGVVFEGHNFEDNLGSLFTGGEDFDGDGIDDFVLVAPYGKPEFVSPIGIGDGEAYLIRGNRNRYSGTYNVNEVSSPTLPGTVLTGIPPTINVFAMPAQTTWGMTAVFISTDADGDGVGELMFGLPQVSLIREIGMAERPSSLTQADMWENGVVVTVSSQNSIIRGYGDTAGSRIKLQFVGMQFQERAIAPEPGLDGESPGACNLEWGWLRDLFTYYEGECPEEEDDICNPLGWDQFGGCLANVSSLITSADGAPDTLVAPTWGFAGYLAVDFINWYGRQ